MINYKMAKAKRRTGRGTRRKGRARKMQATPRHAAFGYGPGQITVHHRPGRRVYNDEKGVWQNELARIALNEGDSQIDINTGPPPSKPPRHPAPRRPGQAMEPEPAPLLEASAGATEGYGAVAAAPQPEEGEDVEESGEDFRPRPPPAAWAGVRQRQALKEEIASEMVKAVERASPQDIADHGKDKIRQMIKDANLDGNIDGKERTVRGRRGKSKSKGKSKGRLECISGIVAEYKSDDPNDKTEFNTISAAKKRIKILAPYFEHFYKMRRSGSAKAQRRARDDSVVKKALNVALGDAQTLCHNVGWIHPAAITEEIFDNLSTADQGALEGPVIGFTSKHQVALPPSSAGKPKSKPKKRKSPRRRRRTRR